MKRVSILLTCLALGAAGCGDDDSGADAGNATGAPSTGDTPSTGDMPSSGDMPSTGDMASVDVDAIVQMALMFDTYEKVNDAPLPSVHGLSNTMNVWVSSDALAAYQALASGTTFGENALLLKEQLNADDSLNSIAVMFKGPAGYAPDAGDWYFGVINPDGSILVGGQPASCVDCHAMASDTDYAYGLADE